MNARTTTRAAYRIRRLEWTCNSSVDPSRHTAQTVFGPIRIRPHEKGGMMVQWLGDFGRHPKRVPNLEVGKLVEWRSFLKRLRPALSRAGKETTDAE